MAKYNYNYISAPPGSGKTEYAIKRALRTLQFNPVMIVVPTIQLCNEIQTRSNGVIRAIHSGVYPDQPINTVIQGIMSGVARTHFNEAIVITDAAFAKLHFRHDSWIVFKDEPREPLAITTLNCVDSWQFVQDHCFDFEPHVTNDCFYTLRIRQPVTYSMKSELDSVFGCLYELQEYLAKSAYFEVLVDRDAWDLTHTLRYSVFQLPECYADWGEVTFMGANFEDSLLYTQWSHQGVVWNNITPPLPAMPTSRMRLRYLFDDMAWSAASRDRQRSGQTNLAWYLEWIRAREPAGDYVYVANNAYGDARLDLPGDRMPAECHGLNHWREVTKCVLLASYHQFPGDEMFYQYYNTSTVDVRGMRNAQYYVQQLTRTNIRVYTDTAPVDVYVPTRREALDLIKYFPDATVVSPDGEDYHLRRNWQPSTLLTDVDPEVSGMTIGTGTFSNAVLTDTEGRVQDAV